MSPPMGLGYSLSSAYPSGLDAGVHVDHVLDCVDAARGANYDYVQAGDHHVAGAGYLQNVPVVGRLTASWDRLGAFFLLPLYDPVLVAEYAGTLAALTEDFEFWCALGHNDRAFDAFGVPKTERAPRFEEALTVIERLWTEDSVTFEGNYYSLDGVSVAPSADPRVCIGGTARPAVERAARRGDAWVAPPGMGRETLAERLGWYEDAGGERVVLRRDALALEDGETARERANEKLTSGYRGWPSDADFALAGDAETVAADLEAYRSLGVDEVVVRPMSRGSAVETLEQVGQARDHL